VTGRDQCLLRSDADFGNAQGYATGASMVRTSANTAWMSRQPTRRFRSALLRRRYPRKWAKIRESTRCHLARAPRTSRAETFRVVDRHKSQPVHDNERIAARSAEPAHKSAAFQFLARGETLAGGNRIKPGPKLLVHQNVGPGGRNASASTTRCEGKYCVILERRSARAAWRNIRRNPREREQGA